jgi:hypothetical protein
MIGRVFHPVRNQIMNDAALREHLLYLLGLGQLVFLRRCLGAWKYQP